VGGHVVMAQGTGTLVALDWTLEPNVYPEPSQNIALEVSIHGLS
jgi:hypothetical protein